MDGNQNQNRSEIKILEFENIGCTTVVWGQKDKQWWKEESIDGGKVEEGGLEGPVWEGKRRTWV